MPRDRCSKTRPYGINPEGAITGSYQGGTQIHGFLRSPDGTFTTFDAPGSADTYPAGINPAGVIAGSYEYNVSATTCCLVDGFIRIP
jgi:hypothetical protein